MQNVLPAKMDSVTVDVLTPDGQMYVTFMENEDGEVVKFHVMIGKAGSAIMAWAQTTADLMTYSVGQGVSLNDLLEVISLQGSGNAPKRQKDGSIVRSGPEGIAWCIHQYKRMKYAEFTAKFNGGRNGPSFGN